MSEYKRPGAYPISNDLRERITNRPITSNDGGELIVDVGETASRWWPPIVYPIESLREEEPPPRRLEIGRWG